MIIEFMTVLIGSILIVLLAHIVIRKSIDLAKHWGLSGTFIGMTILSIGTSLPEMMTHIMGSVQIVREPKLMNTVSSLVIGTNIGSDIFQQQFILGIVAILGVIVITKKEIFPIVGGLIGGAVLLLLLGLNGMFSRWEGALLFFGYLGYLVYLKYAKLNDKMRAKNNLNKLGIMWRILVLLASFGVIAVLADLVLKASEVLVNALPISASFFGVIILGVVAALPELTTALVALKNKRKGMSAGVLIGSNITNPMFALGLGAMISSYVVPKVAIVYDLPFKIIGALLIFWFLWRNRRLQKWEAIVLIAMFFLYLIVRNLFFPVDF